VNCFPLSVNTSEGTPKRRIAAVNASTTARPVGITTMAAMTMYRAWSSMPVPILHSRPARAAASTSRSMWALIGSLLAEVQGDARIVGAVIDVAVEHGMVCVHGQSDRACGGVDGVHEDLPR
jgi:hypothetical protein